MENTGKRKVWACVYWIGAFELETKALTRLQAEKQAKQLVSEGCEFVSICKAR